MFGWLKRLFCGQTCTRSHRKPWHHEIPEQGRFVVDNDLVRPVPGHYGPHYAVVNHHELHELPPGTFHIDEEGQITSVPIITGLAESPEPKSRRKPCTHVTSLAHAGYCVMVDNLKSFIRERLYDPTVVHIDKAAELILAHYCAEQGLFDPTKSIVRAVLPRFLGCEIVWDALSFKFAGDEDRVKSSTPPAAPRHYVPSDTKCAFSQPAACAVPKLTLIPPATKRIPPTTHVVRPIDTVVFEDGAKPAEVTKADVPDGKSLSPQAEALIRTVLDPTRFI